jgi:hypothetical protein
LTIAAANAPGLLVEVVADAARDPPGGVDAAILLEDIPERPVG